MTRRALPSVRSLAIAAAIPLLLGGCGWVALGEPVGPVDSMARRVGDRPPVTTSASPPAPVTRSATVQRLPPTTPRPPEPVEVKELPPPASARARPPSAAVAAGPRDDLSPGGRVVVRPGDTIYGISRRTRVSVKGLIVANDLRAPYQVQPGQELRLPPPPLVHMVRPGDTMYSVSRRYGIDTTSLARVNDLAAPYTIRVGEWLVIPDGTPPPAGATGTAAAPPPAPAAGAPPQSPPQRPTRTPAVAVADPPPATGRGFLLPVQGRIVSGFGPKPGGLHNDGINIAAPRGTPVRAAENGVVAYAGNELPGFGNLVLVKHDDGWMTAYGHNDSIKVRRGQRVARGEAIARVGSTGNVGEPQLHFELRRGTRAIDPKSYFVSG